MDQGFYVIVMDPAHVRFVVPPVVLSKREGIGIWLAVSSLTVTAFLMRLDLGIVVVLGEAWTAWWWLRRFEPAMTENRFSISAAGIVWFGSKSGPTLIAMHRMSRVCLVSPRRRRIVLLSLRAASGEPQALPWRRPERRRLAKWGIVVEADGLDYAIAQGLSRRTALRLARAVRRALRAALRDGHWV
ncbi:hypothetical protein [Mycetohabitans endofungorum]|uniref:hypothetical protein n=1 Tax=Mycetohabitans endofungorum TaxID=417203 RepID=UPI0030D5D8F1